MSFVTDIFWQKKTTPTYVITEFHWKYFKGKFSMRIKNKSWGKVALNGYIIKLSTNWLLNKVRNFVIHRVCKWARGDNSHSLMQKCYWQCELFLPRSLKIGVSAYLYTAIFFFFFFFFFRIISYFYLFFIFFFFFVMKYLSIRRDFTYKMKCVNAWAEVVSDQNR